MYNYKMVYGEPYTDENGEAHCYKLKEDFKCSSDEDFYNKVKEYSIKYPKRFLQRYSKERIDG